MVKEELIQRSPLRIFERSIHGGLNAGEVGLIVSQPGIGKTSMLVQLAMDKLLQGKKVIHVSFTQHTHYVLAWYEDIFDELIDRKQLDNAADVKDEIVKNRVLMNFNQEVMSNEQILKSLRAMIVEGCFAAESIIVDGFDFSNAGIGSGAAARERITNVKAFAKELGLSVWYSCTVKENGVETPPPPLYDNEKIPLAIKDYADLVDIVIVLEPKADHIELSISKDRGAHDLKTLAMRLDPKTLLIQEK
jgi:KaiC/GvpD/RAD55 family RecA-like ATPase